MSAYERAVILDEKEISPKIALVEIYAKTKREKLQSEIKKTFTNKQLSVQQRDTLKRLKSKTSANYRSLKLTAKSSIGYDTNLNISSKSETEVDSLLARLMATLAYKDDFSTSGGWYMKSNALLYYQNNFSASYYNLLLGSIDSGVGYKFVDATTLYLPLSYMKLYYLKKNLLHEYKLEPKIQKIFAQKYLLSFSTKYARRYYESRSDFKRSDRVMGVKVSSYYFFDKNYLYINLGGEFFKALNASSLKFLNKREWSVKSGISYNYKDFIVGKLSYKLRKSFYDGEESRIDFYNQVELKLSHQLDMFEIYALQKYILNSSTFSLANYTKNVYMLGLSFKY